VSRKIRVLHVIHNLNYGGMERLFADIVRLLDPTRFESHIMYVGFLGRFGEGLADVATIHKAAPLSRWSFLHPQRLISQIRRIDPDVIHTHTGVWYKFALAAHRAGVPLVHTEHGRRFPDPWSDRLIDRFASRRTDVVVAVSPVLETHLRDRVVADPRRLVLIPNGVDTELHRPRPDTGELRRELGLDPAVPIIGSIGRLEPVKGYDLMLDAFILLRRKWSGPVPPVLVVGGDGSEMERLRERVRSAQAPGVHLLGWRDDVQHLHSAFTFFTMTSRSEGTSVSLLEAMSTGLVPVVTNVGGNAAVLGPRLAHRLVPSADLEAIAVGWTEVLTNAARRREDSAEARRRIEEGFSLRTMVQGYEALYEGATSGALPAGGGAPARHS
jgi:glycosyltransferase involved in cell wall biosynthesis